MLSPLGAEELRLARKAALHGDYERAVINVLEHPQIAANDRILATPTLVKELPPPLCRGRRRPVG